MSRLQEVRVGAQAIDRFLPLSGEERIREANAVAEEVPKRMEGRVFWNVSSTACDGNA